MGACGADCGITRARERDREAARALAKRLHPDLVWKRRSYPEPAVSFDRRVAIGRHLEDLLPVRAIVRAGDEGAADAIELLAGLHSPALREIADVGSFDPRAPIVLRETYVRVSFSPFDRFVTLQEILLSARATPPGSLGAAQSLEIVEEPMAGVVDRRLAPLVKGLQGVLRKAGLTLLDMAFLMQPIEGVAQAAFVREFDEPPTLWSLLFDPAPPTMIRASLVAARPRPGGLAHVRTCAIA
jgi:hypothetical protein